jgi:MoxR-like ATPase
MPRRKKAEVAVTTAEPLPLIRLGGLLINRQDEILGIAAALVSAQHVFLYGPPGVAKSMLARLICRHIKGARYFEYLLHTHTVPDELFGPLDVLAFREGIYRRITTGRLPEAHIVFLDEIWNASSVILNALLSIVNERRFMDYQTMDVPLVTMICASNGIPSESALKAFYDRILFRFPIEHLPLEHYPAVLEIPDEIPVLPDVAVDLSKLDELRATLPEVKLDEEKVGMLIKILDKVKSIRREPISERRFKWMARALRAIALVQGRTEVDKDDLLMTKYMLWDKPDEYRQIEKVVEEIVDPVYVALREAYASIISKVREATSMIDPAREGMGDKATEFIALATEIGNLVSAARKKAKNPSSRAAQVLGRINAAVELIYNTAVEANWKEEELNTLKELLKMEE